MKRVASVLLLTATFGCQYAEDRALDLYDAIPISVAAGYGASIEARLTPYLGLGAGWNQAWRAGMDEQRFGPLWWEKERGIPILRYYRYQDYLGRCERWSGGDPIWWGELKRKRASSFLIAPGMSRDGEFLFPLLPPYYIRSPWEWPKWAFVNVLNAEVGVFAGVIGVRVAISPLQFLDFVAGLTTWDPAGDDYQKLRVRWPDPGSEPSFEDDENGYITPAKADEEAVEEGS